MHFKFIIAMSAALVLTSPLFSQNCISIQKEIENVTKRGPRSKLALLYKSLGDCLVNQERTEEAIRAFQKALSFPYANLSEEHRLDIAIYLANQNKKQLALAETQKILNHNPNNKIAARLQESLLGRAPTEESKIKSSPQPAISQTEQPQSQQRPDRIELEGEIEKEKNGSRIGRLGYLYKQLGDRYARENEEQLAIQAYENALSYPYEMLNTGSRIEIAEYFANIGYYSLASEELKKILGKYPENVDALTLMGRLLLWQGKYAESEEYIDRALQIQPKTPQALLIKADILRNMGQASQAVHFYQEALKHPLSQTDFFDAQIGLAYAQSETGNYEESEKTIQMISPQSNKQVKKKKSAIAHLERKKTEEPTPRTEEEIKTLCASHLAQIDQATKLKDQKKLSLYYKELGDCYRNHEKREEAADAYEKAFSYPYGSLTIHARIDMAEFLGHQDRYTISAEQLRKVLTDDPDNLRAQIVIARILSWDEKYDEAERYIDLALKKKPKKKESLLIKADILNWTGKYAEAVLLYKELLDKELLLKPEEAFDARYGLAYAFFHLGSYGEGVKYLAELKPEFPYQKRKISRLLEKLDKLDKEKKEDKAKEIVKSFCEGDALKLRLDMVRRFNDCHYYEAAYGILYPLMVCDPCNLSVRIALARTLALEGRYWEALSHLCFVLCKEPRNIDALIIAGTLLRWKGDVPGSICAFNKALSIDPSNFDARLGKAWTYLTYDYRPGTMNLLIDTCPKEQYEFYSMCEIWREFSVGPIFDFRFSRYKDNDNIVFDDYLTQATYYHCDKRYSIYYDHVDTSQPIADSEVDLFEHIDEVGFNVTKTCNPWLSLGGGFGYAHSTEGDTPVGEIFANVRTRCGKYYLASSYDIFSATAAAIFFEIRTWTNLIEYFYKIDGRWSVGGNYSYTKWSDSNHSNKVQLRAEYLLIDAICWDLFVDYQFTYWHFADQPVSPFVIPGVFGGHGYFDPKDYFSNQFGLRLYKDTSFYEIVLRPYVAYATYRELGIHYNGILYAGYASLDYWLTDHLMVGGTLEGGRYPLKNLNYNYSVITARLRWQF
jgi:tetratricopeptide (TPR) repeat protein